MKFRVLYIVLLIVAGSVPSFAQEKVADSSDLQIFFKPSSQLKYGFDDFYHNSWSIEHNDGFDNAHIAVGQNEGETILFTIRDSLPLDPDDLRVKISKGNRSLAAQQINDSLFSIYLPGMPENYTIDVSYKDQETSKLKVHVMTPLMEKVIIVPLGKRTIDLVYLKNYLDKVYRQANLSFAISLAPVFKHKDYPANLSFNNPSQSKNRYTHQMRSFRDAYFEANPNAPKDAYYVFIIDGFVDETLNGFMARNKAMAFVKDQPLDKLVHIIARELGYGVGMLKDSWADNGPEIGTSMNLMDTLGGIDLTHWQWEQIRLSSGSFSFYDEDEDLKTNNGMVAYYFWEENENGVIEIDPNNPLKSLNRPFKKNYRSYHLNIEDYFFRTLFKLGNSFICLWHIIAAVFLLTLAFLLRRKTIRIINNSENISRYWKRPVVVLLALLLALAYYGLVVLINSQLKRYEVRSGHIKDLNGMSYEKVNQAILFDKTLKHSEEDDLESEILVKRGGEWYVKHRKRVLYFEVKQDTLGQWTQCRFYHDDDSLILSTLNFRAFAESHYFVFTYVDSIGNYNSQKVFNHVGIDITEKLEVEDVAKRIMILVNGYRPTSLGRTFEDNFSDIQKRGLEFPDSRNLIFDFDRYDYWHPWKEIDHLFQKRINPSETYYADGHFSVTTSNHRSLLNFSTNSAIYPKRCEDPKKHTCYHTKVTTPGFFGGTNWEKTTDLLATEPNKKGFNYRRDKGRIAGKNLLMMFNEFPNRADNDTIYIVAHSMGYAYALGITDVLRGKINFGGFYIIAAENAESGEVNPKEWKEIWQYGSNFNDGEKDAPCLQDGVAPQKMAKGLTKDYRNYIPKENYTRKGYFDSHFIGYYTWIFDIPKGNKGAIEQR